MKLSEFDYVLPENLIAQYPLPNRDSSRLMILDKKNNTIDHKIFSNLPDYLHKGDLLVLNNTKVLPVRLIGTKKNTGGKVEILLVQETEPGVWKAMVKSSGKLNEKIEIIFNLNSVSAVLVSRERAREGKGDRDNGGLWLLQFKSKNSIENSIENIIEKIGRIPLPPYIKRDHNMPSTLLDKERYQTVYASKNGAIAAPTAGLHFTQDTLNKIKEKGVEIAEITLHIGIGTFKPVRTEFIKQHLMHPEYFEIDSASEKAIINAIENKMRIIAVGTSTVRAIESIRIKEGKIKPQSGGATTKRATAQFANKNFAEKTQFYRFAVQKGYTNLFIYPGFKFQFVNALITNFHLPKSTLLMLIYAFTGKNLAKTAYKEAIAKRYRFYSYGDAMLVL